MGFVSISAIFLIPTYSDIYLDRLRVTVEILVFVDLIREQVVIADDL